MSHGLGVAVREVGHVVDAFRAIRRPRAETDLRTLDGLRDLLAFARANVPHYAGPRYDVRLDTLADLARLPILDKAAVLDGDPGRFHAPGLTPRDYRVDRTSGTTGRVLEVRHDVAAYGYHGATVFRRFLLSGYRPWWRIAHIKPFPRPLRWFQRLGLFPRTVIGAGQGDAKILADVLKVRPHLIMGYPVVLRGLLRAASPADLARLRRTLRMVMTDSELLTDEVRDLLSGGFGAPVYDEYSAYEVLTVSTQCGRGAMHVDEDRVRLEIVGEDGAPVPDGEEGGVVVTHFRERAMPLLRYRLGDRGMIVPGECGCGNRFTRMRVTGGRSDDYVTFPGGHRVYTATFLSLAMWTPGVAESMVRQAADGTVTVHLVAEAGRDFGQVAAAYRRGLAEQVGGPVEVRFERAERVTLTPGGKGRFVESAARPGP
ncbi:MAG: phenylacetate--CoA ligase family protein [Nonomuraea sp.]|nr:phenylacetate--CoA ligase family protein [Nonomuraea sp.]NUT40887.1 phenylacetate--CoA ligase family protein [Thermoactinospora sp.]